MYHWYRNHLSDYLPDKENGSWCREKIPIEVNETTGEIIKEKPLYICKPEHVGERMVLDDKQLGKDVYTIMSNPQTNKIALMIESTKTEELKMAMEHLGKSTEKIKEISCDMAPSYLKLCSETLPLSDIVIDKFHVIKYVYEALQSVRVRIKNELQNSLPKKNAIKLPEKDVKILSDLELLKRTRYLLNKSETDWNEDQKTLMTKLFEQHNELKIAYDLTQQFKTWYRKDTKLSRSPMRLECELYQWYEDVERSKIKEFQSSIKMIERHEENILNFFKSYHTNAKAENLNGKIQRFVSNNYGIKDKDFTLYRIKGYFS